ncbi:MAG: tetratricopeptide repeat protein [bacterium]
MKIRKIYLLVSMTLILFVGQSFAQYGLNNSEMARFRNAQNDTTKLRDFTQELGSNLALKSHRQLGFLKFKGRDYKNAEKEFKLVRNFYKNSDEGKEALYFLARIATFKDSVQEGKKLYEDYLIEAPHGEFAQGAKYYRILQMKKLKDQNKLASIKVFLQEYPDSFYTQHVQYQLVQHYKYAEDFAEAVKEAKKLVNKFPNSSYSADMLYQIGDFLYKANKKEEAKEYYSKLVRESTPNTEHGAISQFLLAETIDKMENPQFAREEYQKVKHNNPNISNWSILSDYSISLSYYNEWNEKRDTANLVLAKSKFKEFIEGNSTDKRTPPACLNMSIICEEEGKYDEAIIYLDKVINFNTSHVTNVAEGFMHQELESHEQLVFKAKLKKAHIYSTNLEKEEEALNLYNNLLSQYPNNGELLISKANSLAKLSKVNEAIETLKVVIDNQLPEKELAAEMLNSYQQNN